MRAASILAAFLVAAARVPQHAAASPFRAERSAEPDDDATVRPPRRLTVAVTQSDEHAATVLSVGNDYDASSGPTGSGGAPAPPGLSAADHVRIVRALERADGHARRAKALVQNPETMAAGQVALDRAERVFEEARALIARSLKFGAGGGEEGPPLLRKGDAGRDDAGTARADEERALDVAHKVVRHLYEEMTVSGKDTIGFTDCKGRLVKHCKTIINRYLRDNGFLWGQQSINIQTFQKRPAVRDPYAEGSNKVIIVTNILGDAVEEEPHYPDGWTWRGRTIGPWPTCVGAPPADCCLTIKNDVLDMDEAGRSIECQFYTPHIADTDVKYPQVTDKYGNPVNGIILYESLDANGDARVEETPFIQADFALPA